MHGVVSTLGSKNDALVESVWDGLEASFHIRGVRVTPYPHFSYQVAEDYDLAELEGRLEGLSRRWPPFVVRAQGLGVFEGPAPVVYVPVIRSAKLSVFQEAVWEAASPASSGTTAFYRPQSWIPHITLAASDTSQKSLGAVLGWLKRRELDLRIRVDSVSVIYGEKGAQRIRSKFALAGRPGRRHRPS